jgi:hypothetical protein
MDKPSTSIDSYHSLNTYRLYKLGYTGNIFQWEVKVKASVRTQ